MIYRIHCKCKHHSFVDVLLCSVRLCSVLFSCHSNALLHLLCCVYHTRTQFGAKKEIENQREGFFVTLANSFSGHVFSAVDKAYNTYTIKMPITIQ